MKDKPETYREMFKIMQKIVGVKGRPYKIDSDIYETAKLKDRKEGILFHPTYRLAVQYSNQNTELYTLGKNNEIIIKIIRHLKEDEENQVYERVMRDDGTEILLRLWNQHMEGYSID